MSKQPRAENEPVIIKKYANRRLYDTESSCYVTLDHLAQMVKDNREFVVKDAKSGEDITHSVLTQIIFDEENKGETLLPSSFLRQLIRFYGDGLEALVPAYLQSSMEAFIRNQEQMRSFFEGGIPVKSGIPAFDQMVQQNMGMFRQAMEMFRPFQGMNMPATGPGMAPAAAPAPRPEKEGRSEELASLKAELAAMQKKISELG